MKKILSLALAAMMVVSVLPVAYAADVDYQTGTNVTVVGDGGEYYVTVPASLEPGQTGTVRAYGKWASNETVKVTTDATVEVEHQETGAKTNVNVTFAGIESLGNDLEDMDVTANISIDKGDIRFGEWKGVIEYNVEFDDGSDPVEMISFTIDGTSYQAEKDMTWEQWVESEYNTQNWEIIYDNYVDKVGKAGGSTYVAVNASQYVMNSNTIWANQEYYTR